MSIDQEVDLSTMDRGDEVPGSEPEKEQPIAQEDENGKQDELPPKEDEGKEEPEAERVRDDKGRFAKKDDDEPRIPKSRFDEQLARERERAAELERRAQEAEAKLAQNKAAEDLAEARTQLKEMIAKRNGFLADGELEKASEMDEKIFDFQNEVAAKQAQQQATVAKEQAKEEIRYDAVVAKLEVDYPQINPDSELYNPDTVRDIQAIMIGLQQSQRMAPSAALSKAVKLVLGAPKADEPAVDKAEEAGMRRKADAVARNAKTAAQQPPKTDKVGVDHDKVGGGIDARNVMKMTQDEFNKLSDDALAKMRGDFI